MPGQFSQPRGSHRRVGGRFLQEKAGEKPVNVAGLGNNQWVAMDYVDVLVHIFQPEARHFYNLENLWEDAALTEVPNIL